MGGIFGRNFLGKLFWEDFLGGIILGGVFWEEFFWEEFFWEEFLGRNSLFTLLMSAKVFEYLEGIDLFVLILVFVKILSKWRRKKILNP